MRQDVDLKSLRLYFCVSTAPHHPGEKLTTHDEVPFLLRSNIGLLLSARAAQHCEVNTVLKVDKVVSMLALPM